MAQPKQQPWRCTGQLIIPIHIIIKIFHQDRARLFARGAIGCGIDDARRKPIAKADLPRQRRQPVQDVGRPRAADDPAGPAPQAPTLPDREFNVLRLLASGHTRQQIAEQLAISRRTVDRTIDDLKAVLAAPTRERLMDAAVELFGERVVLGASVEWVWEPAGFPRGAFSSNFGSKAERRLVVRRVEELPLPGRNINNLALLGPNTFTAPGSTGISANGNRARNNNFMIDGTDNNDLSVTIQTTPVLPEEVAEYQSGTANFSAEFGRNSGAQINVITRSGTNKFKGEVWDYYRSAGLNSLDNIEKANGLEDPTKSVRHQAGFSVGGPNVKTGKNKQDLADQLIADIRNFKAQHGCDRLVMVWTGSTEVFMTEAPVHQTLAAFEAGLAASDDAIPSSMIYALSLIHI